MVAGNNETTHMQNQKISVINYLDMNAIVKNGRLQEYDHRELSEAFPEVAEPILFFWASEWKKARQAMLDLKF